jgi:hypothetical protein
VAGALVGCWDHSKEGLFSVGTYLDMTVLQKGRLRLGCWYNGAAASSSVTAYIWTTPLGEAEVTGQDHVRINKVYATGGSSTEYVELVNYGNKPSNLKGMTLLATESKKLFTFPETIVEPGRSVVVWGDRSGAFSFGSSTALFRDGAAETVMLLAPRQIYDIKP